MFPDLEFIKTILNGLRNRIEKVENWVVSFVRTNRPNWLQNDPDALDYVKNRPFYEEVKFITEGDITDDNSILPEGKYELGKIYIVEVGGVQHQLEFMSVKNGEGRYYVGFNIRGTRYGIDVMDSTKPGFNYYMGTSSPADGLYKLTVYNITKPAHVRVLQPVIHKIDGKYLSTPTADTAGIIKADAAETTDIRPVRLGADGKLYSSREIPIFTTSGTGSTYKANVPEITKLVDGMLVVMIPHVTSTATVPTLNINGLGSYSIYRFVSSSIGSPSPSMYNNWLRSGGPVLLMYSSRRWFACNFPKPSTLDLDGYVPASHGGTGKGSLTAGSYLVGNGTSSVLLKTPTEVLDDIGAIPAPTIAEVGQAIVVKAVDANGKPTEWEAADTASGVQPDWNQNDDTQQDYVKNRPFYTGAPVETVLVEESTVSFTRNEYSGFYLGTLQSTFVATVGETYKVSWDGTTYESTCVSSNGYTVIGNLSMRGAGPDTGEPFIMMVHNRVGIEIATADTSASHTFSIGGFIPEVVKIDRKYLPKAAFITYDSSSSTYNSDLTNDELYEIMLNGEQVVLYDQSEKTHYYLKKWRIHPSGRIDLCFVREEFEITLFPDGTIGKTPNE